MTRLFVLGSLLRAASSAARPFRARVARAQTWALLAACIGLAAGGCATYRFGAQSMFRDDVRTVYVPIIESDSFRRFLGERLTEAVAKEVERRSPYKVVGSGDNADSTLRCRLISDSKRVLAETRTDEPRFDEIEYVVQLEWLDRRGQTLLQRTEVPMPAELLRIGGNAFMVAEVGQTIAVTEQRAIDEVAAQIVDQMEMAW